MDSETIRERLEKLSYRDLQKEAKKHGVKAKGTKEKLLKNVVKKMLGDPLDSSYATSSASAGDTTNQTLGTSYTTADEESSIAPPPANASVIFKEASVSPTKEEVVSPIKSPIKSPDASLMDSATTAADTTIQVLETTCTEDDEKSQIAPPPEKASVILTEVTVSPKKEEVVSPIKSPDALYEASLMDSSYATSAADTTVLESEYTKDESPNAPAPANTSVVLNEVQVSPKKEEVVSPIKSPDDSLMDSSYATSAADTTVPVSESTYTKDEFPNASPPENATVDLNQVSVALMKERSAADATTTQVLESAYTKDDEESQNAPPPAKSSVGMIDVSDSPKKERYGSPLKSPGVNLHFFSELHQKATEKMVDIQTDQKRKEERRDALTKGWTPNINKLSRPKFATPSKKVPESPLKRRRSVTIENGTPQQNKRFRQGLTYPEVTPRLITLAQPKTPPRPRSRAQSIPRVNYTPRKGAYQFIDTTLMSNEKFQEYQKKLAAENRQS